MGANGVEDLAAAGLNTANDVVAVGAEGGRQPERGDSELIRDLVSVSLDRFDGSRAAAADASDYIVSMGPHGAPREFGCVRETSRHTIAMHVDRLDDGVLRGLDAFDQIVAPFAQARQQAIADRLETVVDFSHSRHDVAGGFLARVGEAVGQAFADRLDRYAHSRAFRHDALERRGAGPVHRHGDLIRCGAERCGNFLAGLSEALAQIAASDHEVLGDAVVRCCYGVANSRSAGHD